MAGSGRGRAGWGGGAEWGSSGRTGGRSGWRTVRPGLPPRVESPEPPSDCPTVRLSGASLRRPRIRRRPLRPHDDDHPICRVQVLGRDALHVGGGYGEVAVEVAVDFRHRAVKQAVVLQRLRPTEARLPLVDEVLPKGVARSGQLVRRDAVATHAVQLDPD